VSGVILAIVYRPRPRPIHYVPTTMAVPTTDNPLSMRVMFPPVQTRGLTTVTD